jgi:hypothetical protein
MMPRYPIQLERLIVNRISINMDASSREEAVQRAINWAGDPANRDAIEKVQDEFDLGLEWRVKVDDDDDDDK